MAVVLRFVDVHGVLCERIFDIVRVSDTTSSKLKKRYMMFLHIIT